MEVKGNVVPSEKGLVQGPLTDARQCGRALRWEASFRFRRQSGARRSSEQGQRTPVLGRRQLWRSGPNYSGWRRRYSRSAFDREIWPVPRPATGTRGILEHARSQQQGLLRLYQDDELLRGMLTPADALYARVRRAASKAGPTEKRSGTAPLGELVVYAAPARTAN